jgi:hypothetical protein
MFIPLKMVLIGIDPYPFDYNAMILWMVAKFCTTNFGWLKREKNTEINLYHLSTGDSDLAG